VQAFQGFLSSSEMNQASQVAFAFVPIVIATPLASWLVISHCSTFKNLLDSTQWTQREGDEWLCLLQLWQLSATCSSAFVMFTNGSQCGCLGEATVQERNASPFCS